MMPLRRRLARARSSRPWRSPWRVRSVPRMDDASPPVNDLLNNHLAGGIPRALGGQLGKLSDTALRDTLGTALNLAVSDFSLRDLKRRPTTLYLVIPTGRFLRLFVNMAVSAAVRDPLKLYVLDEFCPRPDESADGGVVKSRRLRREAVAYHPEHQPVAGTLPKNWETFMGNAGLWQVFAVNDQSTAQYLSERLGMFVRWRKLNSLEGSEWLPQNPTFLRTSVEVAQETDRDSGRQFIYREGGDCLFLRRRRGR
jgi:hypothetical protein